MARGGVSERFINALVGILQVNVFADDSDLDLLLRVHSEDDDVAPEDLAFESHGVRVLIDPKSLAYLDGTELDFVREGLNEGFKFNNPNEKDRCGCGESFNV